MSLALACGLGRTQVPAESWLSDHHRKLADVVRNDPEVPRLIRQARLADLRAHLDSMPPPEDLDALQEELRLEFAAVLSRLPDFLAQQTAVAKLWGLVIGASGKGASRANARSRLAYNLVCDTRIKLQGALNQFNKRASEKKGWAQLASITALRRLALAHARAAGKPPPPRRYGK